MLDWADEAYWSAVRAKANADGEFARHAKFWEATIRLGIGQRNFRLRVDKGAVSRIERFSGGMGVDLAIQAPDADWDALLSALPPPFYQDLYPASLHHGFDVVGSIADYCAHYPAIRRLIEIMREVHAGAGDHEAPATRPNGQFEAATGRYVHLPIDDATHRVYFEETGTGDVGLLMQHTAGADARQWRHVLEDADLQSKFRLVAYDLPYHGKSVPPTDVHWWQQEYRLTRDFLMAVPIALASALRLERPVYMGSSIGGHLAVDLALHHPREFRAVVGLEAAGLHAGRLRRRVQPPAHRQRVQGCADVRHDGADESRSLSARDRVGVQPGGRRQCSRATSTTTRWITTCATRRRRSTPNSARWTS